MIYVHAERESDWPLHIAAVEQMLSYMFAPGHLDHARYGLYYLRNMQAMPLDIWKQFMKGEHTMHHNPCSSSQIIWGTGMVLGEWLKPGTYRNGR